MSDHILVTGGTGVIGSEIVRRLLADGYCVAYTSRTPGPHDAFDDLGARYEDGSLLGIDCDLTVEGGLLRLLSRCRGLTSLAGIVHAARSLDSLAVLPDGTSSSEHMLDEYYVDVVVPYRLSVELARYRNFKHVVLIGSIYGAHPFNPRLYRNDAARAPIQYSLAKAALLQLQRELAIRLAPNGVRVNTVSYGGVVGRVDESFAEAYARECAGPGMLRPRQVAGPVSYLLSEDAGGITGVNLRQDNGYGLW